MKDNKLIAEFMGYKTYEHTDTVAIRLTEDNEFNSKTFGHIHTEFHSNWNWLMRVVDEIEMRCQGVPQELLHLSLFSTRQEVYQAVVEFIKHINK